MLIGLMNGVMLLTVQLDVFTYTVMLHSMTFLVVGMALTAESGDILFNVNESDVLLHKGDVVIQLGNWHTWDNRSGVATLMSYVMIGGEFAA